ncbi:XRE family transcriptional regulator [Candidatus Accumulibacter vicinus]|uniref:Pyocin repressor protein n=1 Tax=Candidatus Accumulibacter vicinus TaxID=2954382 RepID=A0A084Y2D7_9PROT|nr:XRE family transcriptional regulator [Candidatus Accumulibacter vicinus]KFB68881.1 MAG: Pyocin repressor protein [Candidatus Accumulibacter vicinus]
MNTLAERLREARSAKGWSKAELMRRAGLRSASTLSEMENGEIHDSPQLPAIADALGVEVLWLQQGRGPRARKGEVAQEVFPGDTRCAIRRVRFKLSAGVSGYEIEYDNGEAEPIFMARRWFDQHRYRPEMLLAVKVSGRSMEPSLYDGDLVVINTADTHLRDGQVYAANYEGELVIKRLRRDAGQWFLSSDSPDKARYGDKRCSEDCGLIGRIVYRQTEHI